MSSTCAPHEHFDELSQSPGWKRVLWIALVLNAGMLLVEIYGGVTAESSALLADALDFFGDASNYAISLLVAGMPLLIRNRAAYFKGVSVTFFGLLVLVNTAWHVMHGTIPEASVMGIIGLLALITNVSVAVMLYRFRGGDANMRSVWICSRNDAIGNLAILFAALGVFGTGTGYPDFIVATIMIVLAISAGVQVMYEAYRENQKELEYHSHDDHA